MPEAAPATRSPTTRRARWPAPHREVPATCRRLRFGAFGGSRRGRRCWPKVNGERDKVVPWWSAVLVRRQSTAMGCCGMTLAQSNAIVISTDGRVRLERCGGTAVEKSMIRRACKTAHLHANGRVDHVEPSSRSTGRRTGVRQCGAGGDGEDHQGTCASSDVALLWGCRDWLTPTGHGHAGTDDTERHQ